MTSDELAAEVASRIAASIPRITERITGIGASQYGYGDLQVFETRTPQRILREAREEVDDLVCYVLMCGLRIDAILEAMGEE